MPFWKRRHPPPPRRAHTCLGVALLTVPRLPVQRACWDLALPTCCSARLTSTPNPPCPTLLQLVWSAVPAAAAGGASVRYAVQRWPTADMPAPGERGYLDSLFSAPYDFDAADGSYTAADATVGAAATAGGGGPRRRPFYRILALNSSGAPLAATRPAQAVVAQGEVTGMAGRGKGQVLVAAIGRSASGGAAPAHRARVQSSMPAFPLAHCMSPSSRCRQRVCVGAALPRGPLPPAAPAGHHPGRHRRSFDRRWRHRQRGSR